MAHRPRSSSTTPGMYASGERPAPPRGRERGLRPSVPERVSGGARSGELGKAGREASPARPRARAIACPITLEKEGLSVGVTRHRRRSSDLENWPLASSDRRTAPSPAPPSLRAGRRSARTDAFQPSCRSRFRWLSRHRSIAHRRAQQEELRLQTPGEAVGPTPPPRSSDGASTPARDLQRLALHLQSWAHPATLRCQAATRQAEAIGRASTSGRGVHVHQAQSRQTGAITGQLVTALAAELGRCTRNISEKEKRKMRGRGRRLAGQVVHGFKSA